MIEDARTRTWCIDGTTLRGMIRPDGRLQLWLPDVDTRAWPALVGLASMDVGGPFLVTRSGDDRAAAVAALRTAGFQRARTETLWRIPVRSLARFRPRGSHHLVPVTELDPAAVAELDNAVREDIPGTQGWQGTAGDLEETLADPELDPELYLIARDPASGSLDGLVRVWNRLPDPRLGCLGVRRSWRRTGLAADLVAAVAVTLQARGVTHVITETDTTNAAASLAAANHGGLRTGSLVEWERLP